MIDITELYLHVINRTYIYVLYYIYVRILLGFDAKIKNNFEEQRAKRWLYLSNPSSINQYESNAKKKKKKKNNSSYSNSYKILFLI